MAVGALEREMTGHEHHHHGSSDADERLSVIDPVCGMTVDPAKTTHHAEHAGHAFHFCSAWCVVFAGSTVIPQTGSITLRRSSASEEPWWWCSCPVISRSSAPTAIYPY